MGGGGEPAVAGAANAEVRATEAMIFLPAIGPWTDRGMERMVLRLALAFEEQAVRQNKFTTKARPQELVYGQGPAKHKSSVHSIAVAPVSAPQESKDVLDVYEMDYSEMFPQAFEKYSPLRKAAYVATSTSLAIGRLAFAFRRRGASRTDKGHFVFASVLVLGLAVYAAVLGWAFFDTAKAALPDKTTAASPSASPSPSPGGDETSGDGAGETTDDPLTNPQRFALVMTAAGFAVPKVRKSLERASIDYVSAIGYLQNGKHRAEMETQLAALLEAVSEADQYDRIHLFAYSFGSLVALDSIFTSGGDHKPRFDDVHTLVTIGCPADLARTFWPKYLRDRKAPVTAPARWVNVWARGDTLSSNFRNGPDESAEAVVVATRPSGESVAPTNVPFTDGPAGEPLHFMETFAMRGLRNHVLYWGESPEGVVAGCFSQIVRHVWPGLLEPV